jgi:hypothetical protein
MRVTVWSIFVQWRQSSFRFRGGCGVGRSYEAVTEAVRGCVIDGMGVGVRVVMIVAMMSVIVTMVVVAVVFRVIMAVIMSMIMSMAMTVAPMRMGVVEASESDYIHQKS